MAEKGIPVRFINFQLLEVCMKCRVVVEVAVSVYDVDNQNEAVQIAISKIGDMLNPDLNYVDIEVRNRDDEGDPAYIVADEALVGLELEMTVFDVEEKEHASRVASKEIGERLSNIPLDVIEIEEMPEDEDQNEEESVDNNSNNDDSSNETTNETDDDDDTLPEIDELADE